MKPLAYPPYFPYSYARGDREGTGLGGEAGGLPLEAGEGLSILTPGAEEHPVGHTPGIPHLGEIALQVISMAGGGYPKRLAQLACQGCKGPGAKTPLRLSPPPS
jgi:hypothetical protein